MKIIESLLHTLIVLSKVVFFRVRYSDIYAGAGLLGIIAGFLAGSQILILAGFVASIIFVIRVYKQIKNQNNEQVSIAPQMSKFEIAVGGVATIIILTAPYFGIFWNNIFCSFLNCGPK